uniref:Brix domain-containing protein n=1 Tax=Coccolithus braarudii TaxID=221442 RepID=A0A7S0LPP0_9EUKA|mmetsp:Transcript_51968/g.111090  ORF Transcript_51968/g.111090 Transcript_51968/m.111090 type:complete len:216 (+) Transcript_51968:162-809(+)|eukprot:CAMPEP_0183332394 /NCGR_PEP_ID=MMETSP0164_2-20130417/1576_1 /TAXON_ID=221442 /ORGANISM="Coccolithus pelagicus ssp braarudi, Strain PLY182g" /LENGTH=215 /DNA_ID=CAMNT_0025501101 /DNA_START=154 /DNA_END=801 /DNA_ORIENTATION=+
MTSGGCLVLSTRGIKARPRHLLRDLLRLLPHAIESSKLDTDDGLEQVVGKCEDSDCSSAMLLDCRDRRRVYMWLANCPEGPSAMLRVLNMHTVAELKLDARRVLGARNVLVFDPVFSHGAEKQVLRELLTRVFSVPRSRGKRVSAATSTGTRESVARHTVSFSWLDGSIWIRVYRMDVSEIDPQQTELNEIGPRLVLRPIRIIAGGFSGSILNGT